MTQKVVAFGPDSAKDANRLFARTRREPYNRKVQEEFVALVDRPHSLLFKVPTSGIDGRDVSDDSMAGVDCYVCHVDPSDGDHKIVARTDYQIRVYNPSLVPLLSTFAYAHLNDVGLWICGCDHLSLAKMTSDVSAHTSFTSYQWWQGTPLSGSANGSTVQSAITMVSLVSGTFIEISQTNGYLQAKPLQC